MNQLSSPTRASILFRNAIPVFAHLFTFLQMGCASSKTNVVVSTAPPTTNPNAPKPASSTAQPAAKPSTAPATTQATAPAKVVAPAVVEPMKKPVQAPAPVQAAPPTKVCIFCLMLFFKSHPSFFPTFHVQWKFSWFFL